MKTLSDKFTAVCLTGNGSVRIWDAQAGTEASTFSCVPSITVPNPTELIKAIQDLIDEQKEVE